jgi:ABC-type lipoprotein export system ATPase subunit
MVTHDARIASVADRIVFLKDGAIVDQTQTETNGGNNAEWVADKVRQMA